MGNSLGVFFILMFAAVFLLTIALTMPVFGENRGSAKKVKQRLARLADEAEMPEALRSLRKNREREPDGLEVALGDTAIGNWYKVLIEQSGQNVRFGRQLLLSLALGAVAAWIAWLLIPFVLVALVAGLMAAAVPTFQLVRKRQQKFDKFEEQLPDAIDVMRRALQAGYPFSEALKLVGEEMEDPIRKEFALTFSDLNYGNDIKWALVGLLERVPSVNVMALVASILIQRETGGNLAEILGKLSSVIRGRFKFHRKVRTLSAEGRMSTWVLALTPFVLAFVLHLTTPGYLTPLAETDTGLKLIAGALGGITLGIFWLRRIIRIEV